MAIPMNKPPNAAHSQRIQLLILRLLLASTMCDSRANMALDLGSGTLLYFSYSSLAQAILCFFSSSSRLSSSLLNSSGKMGAFIFSCLLIITKGAWKSDLGLQSLKLARDLCSSEQLLLEVGNRFSSSKSSLSSSQNSCLSMILTSKSTHASLSSSFSFSLAAYTFSCKYFSIQMVQWPKNISFLDRNILNTRAISEEQGILILSSQNEATPFFTRGWSLILKQLSPSPQWISHMTLEDDLACLPTSKETSVMSTRYSLLVILFILEYNRIISSISINMHNSSSVRRQPNLDLKHRNSIYQILPSRNIRHEATYHRYLAALRNNQTTQSFLNYSKQIMAEDQQEPDQSQSADQISHLPSLYIKWSPYLQQDLITQEVLKVSQQMNFDFPHRQSSCAIQRQPKQQPQFNQPPDEDDEVIKSGLQFASEGVSHNLLRNELPYKFDLFRSIDKANQDCQGSSASKNKVSKKKLSNINFQVRSHDRLRKILKKTNSQPLNQSLCHVDMKNNEFKSTSDPIQGDFGDLHKYKKKLGKFYSRRVQMTGSRQDEVSQAGVLKEKIQSKTECQTLDILSSIIAEKPRIEVESGSRWWGNGWDKQNFKFSISQLTGKCRQNFSFLKDSECLKL